MTQGWLEGRTALVTGGATGMGRAISESLSGAGARVAIGSLAKGANLNSAAYAHLPDDDEIGKAVAAIKAQGGDARAFPLDLRDEQSVDAFHQATVEALGPVDILINAAGVSAQALITDDDSDGVWQTVLDINLHRLRWFDNNFEGRVKTLYSSTHNLEQALGHADLVVGAVLVAGAKAPNLVTRAHLSLMQPGAAIVDVAVDQGGCVETTHATTHADPIYTVDGIVHYAVANMPGAVARTSTFALNNATMRQGVMIANMGWREAIKADPTLRPGVNVVDGRVTYEAVAKAHGMDFSPLS